MKKLETPRVQEYPCDNFTVLLELFMNPSRSCSVRNQGWRYWINVTGNDWDDSRFQIIYENFTTPTLTYLAQQPKKQVFLLISAATGLLMLFSFSVNLELGQNGQIIGRKAVLSLCERTEDFVIPLTITGFFSGASESASDFPVRRSGNWCPCVSAVGHASISSGPP